ncbi:Hypothetical predicted protein [Pelobates cultripes]|uniref:Uncharacterized protein n=1 Tax=Pelobates cultripes TaxID=61616 RepID=A0AAD1SN91_PELCU|nr:Hypothetical predicted protein [Pelobates cultripes]
MSHPAPLTFIILLSLSSYIDCDCKWLHQQAETISNKLLQTFNLLIPDEDFSDNCPSGPTLPKIKSGGSPIRAAANVWNVLNETKLFLETQYKRLDLEQPAWDEMKELFKHQEEELHKCVPDTAISHHNAWKISKYFLKLEKKVQKQDHPKTPTQSGFTTTGMTLIPSDLTILSINAKGLNKPEKRTGALRDFHAWKASIVMIQETHFREGDRHKLTNHHFPIGYYSDFHGGKSRGAAILINKKVPFVEKASMTDREGRYLFIKDTVAEHLYTFTTLYAPNNKQHRYLKRTLHKLHSFAEGQWTRSGTVPQVHHTSPNSISHTKPGKSPGPDVLPLCYYKRFADKLYQPMLASFNAPTPPTPRATRSLLPSPPQPSPGIPPPPPPLPPYFTKDT